MSGPFTEAAHDGTYADEHAPLLTPARGRVPAFDQQLRRPGVCRRLHNRCKAAYLGWLLRELRKQLDKLEEQMSTATDQAVILASLHRVNPALQGYRRDLRERHELTAQRWLVVRQELDNLQVVL